MKKFFTLLSLLSLSSFAFGQNLLCTEILSPGGQPISDVSLQIETLQPGESTGPITPAPMLNGCIDLDALPAVSTGGTYKVYPEKTGDDANGVSTLDMVLILRHLLGITALDPLHQLAADVDGNQVINIQDMLLIRALVLHIIDEFPVSSWEFLDAAFDPNDPSSPMLNYIEFDPASPPADLAFIGVKLGDVNNITGGQEAADRSASELPFKVVDQFVEANETLTVDFLAKDFTDIMAYQFTLSLDTDLLEFVDYEMKALSEDYVHGWNVDLGSTGNIPNLWLAPIDKLDLPDNTVLFTVTFRAKQSTLLSEAISATANVADNLAVEENQNELLTVVLDFNLNTTVQESQESPLALQQNQPNPMDQFTDIPVFLNQAGKTSLNICDAHGKIVKSIPLDGQAGLQTIHLNRSDFGAPGVYTYYLQGENIQSAKQLIVK